MSDLVTRSAEAASKLRRKCSHCQKWIIWGQTEESRMPVDAADDPHGNVLLILDGGRVHAKPIGTARSRKAHRAAGWELHLPHKLSCVRAAEWTRSHGAGAGAARRPPVRGQA